MFTGIVQRGVVVEVGGDTATKTLTVESPALEGTSLGGSVAVDGVCLTATEVSGCRCAFDLSSETLARTTLGERNAGDPVNIERPKRLGAELGGHIVQGHVDATGRVEGWSTDGRVPRLRISCPPEVHRYLVPKGSVAVDGVSLTVAALTDGNFDVALVPHTLAASTLGLMKRGRRVNIEVDVLSKYVERLVAWQAQPLKPLRPTAGTTQGE